MNSGQVLQEVLRASFDNGQRGKSHFADVTEMASYGRQLRPRKQNVRYAGAIHGNI